MRSRTVNGCLLFVLGLICATYAQLPEDACSPNQYLECVDEANCSIINEAGDWECVCTEGNGDGLKNGTGCGLPKCRWDSDCHPHALCLSETCQCQNGYAGDGLVGENRTGCYDVDECATSPCHAKASCYNNDGSFVCICNATAGYTGNGFICTHTCNTDDDCEDVVEHCAAFECVCNTGYHYRPGTVICENTNECELGLCDPNATCTDTLGSYTCVCNEGFSGDGVSCTELPRNCHDILTQDPTAESAEYDINPDGPGPLQTTTVECDMRPGLGITIFHVATRTYRFRRNRSTFNINYLNSVDHIKTVIDQSGYCTQEESYTCKFGAILMNGNSYQIDGNGVPHFSWGGSYISNTCECGLLGFCYLPFSTCNCDGSSGTRTDNGKLTNKSLLPIKKVVNQINSGVGIATIGPVKCAPKTFDVPIDCHDAKFNINIKNSGPQILDVDGPDGPLDPILAHCDMETYKHAGVTIIPPLNRIPVELTEPGQYNITYTSDVNAMKKLVEISHFCYQEGGYKCNNSRLLNNGDKKGWISDLNGNDMDYFLGGLGYQWSCGCAITGTCASDDFGCNCDVNDGKVRSDYGRALKPDVPIGSFTSTEVGPGHYGEYYIAPLMCSQREFGIHATCDGYLVEDYDENHTFLIDPDGPADPDDEDEENEDMFPAYCEFHKDPDYAVTVIHTDKETENETFYNGFESWYGYRLVGTGQLEALTARALYCTQVISYACELAPIHDAGGEPVVTWTTKDGRTMAYFAGIGEYNICECAITHSCENDMACNCDMDDDVLRQDDGLLLNKDHLPIMSVNASYIGAGGEAIVSVGPMKCYDLFPNCYHLKRHNKYYLLEGEPPKKDGLNTIDPDGAGGVEPFLVECDGYFTRVPVVPEDTSEETTSNSSSPVTNCYDIQYAVDGNEVTPKQIQALVDNSLHCTQTIIMDCLNAPITDRVYYNKCDGQRIDGWAGSNAVDKCGCGVVNGCDKGMACNCDVVDGEWRKDGSIVYNKDLLPACEICITLDSAENITTDPKKRTSRTTVTNLICNNKRIGGSVSCQSKRNEGFTESGTFQLDPDRHYKQPSFPVWCEISVYPPVGFSVIHPTEPEIDVNSTGIDQFVYYYAFSMYLIELLIAKSDYCTQEIYIECHNSSLSFNISAGDGWYDKNGFLQPYWAGNEDEFGGCAGGSCNCNLGGDQIDGGVITDKKKLPVSRVKIGHVDEIEDPEARRTLHIGPVKCYDLYPTCHAIKKARAHKRGNGVYVIDPDQEGPIPYFAVECDFTTDKSIGITIIDIDNTYDWIQGQVNPGGTPIPIEYNVTHEQIEALADVSEFCQQRMRFNCINTPLINFNDPPMGYYSVYGDEQDEQSPSFGVAGHSDTNGCSCVVTNTCPEGYSCHCDKPGAYTVEYGHETNKSAFPIISHHFGGQTAGSLATFQLDDLRCGPKPFDLPKNCEEALHWDPPYEKSGEVLIWPHADVEPFNVYCDMNIIKGRAVTIIHHHYEELTNVTWDEDVTLDYYDAMDEQVVKLVEASEYCFQPFKYICTRTKFDGFFHWEGGYTDDELTYTGSGRSYIGECNCGEQGLCGGSEERNTLLALNRTCNCDAADNLTRADAGIYRDKPFLPMRSLHFADPNISEASGQLIVGPLYCSEVEYDLNECKHNWHDCHPKATCTKIPGSYTCRCKKGWRGLGRPEVWANGRNCYDDDECRMGRCPYKSSICLNWDGGYNCTCKEGYEQTGPRKCRDIDECTEETGKPKCDVNARCINIAGGYRCKCKRGYIGDGFTCEEVAVCACFGDPHCMSWDNKLLTFQGKCQYVMASDHCTENPDTPKFEVYSTFTDRNTNLPVSWVQDVTVKINNYTIELKQNRKVLVNGILLTGLPYRLIDVKIEFYGRYVEVRTEFGFQVNWDGKEVVEVYVPGQWKEKVCGLCGNYNDNATDDWYPGPECPNTNNSYVLNANYFGNSWVVPDYVTQHSECSPNCTETNDTACTEEERQSAKQACLKIFKRNGKFKECFSEMEDEGDEHIIEMFEEACIIDACSYDGDLSVVICASAQKLLDECSRVYEVEIESFRTDGFCEIDCEEEMENSVYYPCGPTVQPTCLDVLTNTILNDTGTCMEGCLCPEGLVRDGNKCVNETDCGCIENDMYYSIGDTRTLAGCGTIGVCTANHTFNDTSIRCLENATCGNVDGVIGCHCNEGLYGDGVNQCKPDPCSPSPCQVNETCIRDEEGETERGYYCICAEGYTGDCDACEDIDECRTGTHDCPPKSECINTPGSFACVCKEGYRLFNHRCEDIDECELDTEEPSCGNNSKCSNKIGGYACPCCQGYEKDDNGTCIESANPPEEDQPYCCTCDIPHICKDKRQVCGEDGVTYNNMKDMLIQKCEAGLHPRKWLQVDYFHRCKVSCSKIRCPKYQECNPATKKCDCIPCTPEEKNSTEMVCTTKRDIYLNICAFKKAQCHYDTEVLVEIEPTFTPCEGTPGTTPVGDWSDPGPCSVTCGAGTQVRTRTPKRNLTAEEKIKFPTEHVSECFKDPCEDGPCFNVTCTIVGEECVVNNDTDAAECICPPWDELDFEEVCGYVVFTVGGTRPREWQNEGELRNYACRNYADDYTVMNDGKCGDEPINCTRVLKTDYYRLNDTSNNNNNCTSIDEMNWYTCDGGCADIKEMCCHPVAEVTETVNMNCEGEAEPKSFQVTYPTKCECIDVEIAHGG